MGGNGDPKPPVGSFEKCARCEKQFTVVIMASARLEYISFFPSPDEIYASGKPASWLSLPPVFESIWGRSIQETDCSEKEETGS